MCRGDTQLTSCWSDITHNKQGDVWIWHTIHKMWFGYDTPLRRCCLDMTQLTICCVEIIHNQQDVVPKMIHNKQDVM